MAQRLLKRTMRISGYALALVLSSMVGMLLHKSVKAGAHFTPDFTLSLFGEVAHADTDPGGDSSDGSLYGDGGDGSDGSGGNGGDDG